MSRQQRQPSARQRARAEYLHKRQAPPHPLNNRWSDGEYWISELQNYIFIKKTLPTSFLLKNEERMNAAIVLPISAVYVLTMPRFRASTPYALAELKDGQNTHKNPVA